MHSARNMHEASQGIHNRHQLGSARASALREAFGPKHQMGDGKSAQGWNTKKTKRPTGQSHPLKIKDAHCAHIDKHTRNGTGFGGAGVAPRLQVDLDKPDQAQCVNQNQSLPSAKRNHSGPDGNAHLFKTT